MAVNEAVMRIAVVNLVFKFDDVGGKPLVISSPRPASATITVSSQQITAVGMGPRDGLLTTKATSPGARTASMQITDQAAAESLYDAIAAQRSFTPEAGTPFNRGYQATIEAGETTFELPVAPIANSVSVSTPYPADVTESAVDGGLGATSVDVSGTTVTLTGATVTETTELAVAYQIDASTSRMTSFGGGPNPNELAVASFAGDILKSDGGLIPFSFDKGRINGNLALPLNGQSPSNLGVQFVGEISPSDGSIWKYLNGAFANT